MSWTHHFGEILCDVSNFFIFKEDNMDKVKIGVTIKIIKMEGEPLYTDRESVVTHIDDAVNTPCAGILFCRSAR